MIVAASTTLLAESRSGRNGGILPWALLVAGSVASLAANVAVAEAPAACSATRGLRCSGGTGHLQRASSAHTTLRR